MDIERCQNKLDRAKQRSRTSTEDGSMLVVETQIVQGERLPVETDAVFGDLIHNGPNYRDVGWLGAIALMLKTQIGLGVLSIPYVFNVLGLIPGVCLICFIACLNAWSNYEVGVFKVNHTSVYSIDDAGMLVFGRVGRELLAVAFVIYVTLGASSAILSVSIGFNAVSLHGTCTAVFVAVAAVAGWGIASVRTLGKLTWIVWVGMTCIIGSLLVLTVSVGIQDRPSAAPQVGPWMSDYKLVGHPSFTDAIAAVSSIIFASLYCTQIIVTGLYITIGTVVYYFCGSYVASPALGSAGVLLKRICYGIALPGLLVTTAFLTHIPAKFVFIRLLRGSPHLTNGSAVHWMTWLGCTSCVAMVAYICASAIPIFNSLISLVGALFGTFLSFQPLACMWLYDNWKRHDRDWKWIGMVAFCCFLISAGTFLMVAGSYSAIVEIIKDYDARGGLAAWSCADNSASV